MDMHRFYLPPDQSQTETPILEEKEAHHALHVLRLRPGEIVMALDGHGSRLTCQVMDTGRRTVRLQVLERETIQAPAREIILVQAVPKTKAMEWIVQKATELGATCIVPLISERVIVRHDPEALKTEKWRWIAIEAMKQCGTAWLPRLEDPMRLPEFIERQTKIDLSLLASIMSRKHPRSVFQDFLNQHHRPPVSAAVWIGPEGDFTSEEMEQILAASVVPISLGTSILRSETAAIYGLSILNYEMLAEPPREAQARS